MFGNPFNSKQVLHTGETSTTRIEIITSNYRRIWCTHQRMGIVVSSIVNNVRIDDWMAKLAIIATGGKRSEKQVSVRPRKSA